MNAKLLTEQFIDRGYQAEAWYMMNVASAEDDADFVRILHRKPPPAKDWPKMLVDFHRAVLEARPVGMIGFHPLANIAGAFAARKVGAPFVGTQRNPYDSQNVILGQVEKYLGSTSYYQRNVAVSEAVLDTYSHYPSRYKSKMEVIYNALPPLPLVDEDAMAARQILKLPEKSFLLGSLGRLADQKNVEFLIEVIALLPDMTLVIAGEGPNEEAIRNKVKELGVSDRVLMTGPLRGRDVSLFYRAIDIFTLPSRYEGFGRTMIESLASGTITVANDLPVTREVSKGAAVLQPLQAPLWADAIRKLRETTPDALNERRDLSRQIGSSYTMEPVVDAYLAALGLMPWKNGSGVDPARG